MSNGFGLCKPDYPMVDVQSERPLLERLKMHEQELNERRRKVSEAIEALEKSPEIRAAFDAVSQIEWR